MSKLKKIFIGFFVGLAMSAVYVVGVEAFIRTMDYLANEQLISTYQVEVPLKTQVKNKPDLEECQTRLYEHLTGKKAPTWEVLHAVN